MNLLQLFKENAYISRLSLMQVHLGLSVKESGGETDHDSCFNFIASEHPNFNTRFLCKLDGVGHLILQSVLNGSGAEDSQLDLNFFINGGDLLLSFGQGELGLL